MHLNDGEEHKVMNRHTESRAAENEETFVSPFYEYFKNIAVINLPLPNQNQKNENKKQ